MPVTISNSVNQLQKKMAPGTFESLPPELLSSIGALLPQADCSNLSLANSYFRSVLAPFISFHTLTLTNCPNNDWESLRRVANKYGQHVREVRFVGNMYPGPAALVEKDPDMAPYFRTGPLPSLIRETLCGSLFPAADTYQVSFDFDFVEDPIWPPPGRGPWEHESDDIPHGSIDRIYIFEIPEVEEAAVKAKEAQYPWRSFMAEVWHVLSQNMKVKTLVAKDLLPKPTSPFFSRQWSDFLARLRKLEISMWAETDGACITPNSLDGYRKFIDRLGQYFFQHATQAQSLVLAANPKCPFGLYGDFCDISLPLRIGQLPDLRHLELREIYISSDLVDFVGWQKSRVNRLVLRSCHANLKVAWGDLYTWADFFDGLAVEDDNRLHSFVVQYDGLVRMSNNPENGRESVRREHRHVFDYGSCETHCGYFEAEIEENYNHFAAGRDLAGFQSLAARIHRNTGSAKDGAVSYVALSNEPY